MGVGLHASIALLYLALAVVLASALQLPDATWRQLVVARLAAAAFFIGCALHHVDMLTHGLGQATALDYGAVHHLVPGLLQVVGAAAFTWVALSAHVSDLYLAVRQRGEDHA